MTVSAGNPAVVKLCPAAAPHGTGVFAGKLISVTSVADVQAPLQVVVKFNHPAENADDAYLSLLTHAWGSDYRAVGYEPAPVDFARYTVVTNQAIPSLVVEDCAGVSSTTPLAPGEVFQMACKGDISARRVRSAGGERFGLVSGATCAFVPAGAGACEVLMDQVPPNMGSAYFQVSAPGCAAEGATAGDAALSDCPP